MLHTIVSTRCTSTDDHIPPSGMIACLKSSFLLDYSEEEAMRPSKDIINKFKILMLQEFNEDLKDDEAREKFERLDGALRIVLRIQPDGTKEINAQ